MNTPTGFYCEACDRSVEYDAAIRRQTVGGLDPEKWQMFCCDRCGNRLETVFVGDE